MNAEFILVEFGREIDYARLMVEKKDAHGAPREEIQDLLELIERLERLRSRFLAHC